MGIFISNFFNNLNTLNTLYTINKINEDLILLPKNENQSYTTVLIWLTGIEEPPEDFQSMFLYSPSYYLI